MKPQSPQPPFEFEPWLKDAKISRTTEHRLPPEKKPKSVTIGRRKFIIETPAEWITRIYEQQQMAA